MSIFPTGNIVQRKKLRLMIKRLISIIIPIFFILPLEAQHDTLKLKYEVFRPHCTWDYGAGARFSFLDFDEMNRTLVEAGLPELESPVPCVALAARSSFFWRHFQIETALEITSGSSKKNTLENRQSVVFRDYALRSRVMLDLLHQKRLTKIFPFAGLGLSYQNLSTRSVENNPGNIIPVENSAYQVRRFNQIPFVCEFGLSVEKGVSVRNKDVFVGLRGGYALRFLENKWVLNNNDVAIPQPAASAPFVGMMLRIKTAPKNDKPHFGKG